MMEQKPGTACGLRRVALAIAASAVVACGGGGGGAGGGAAEGVDGSPYFPLSVGDRWYYAEGSDVSTVKVVGTRPVSAGTAYVLRSESAAAVVEEQYVKSANAVTYVPSATDDDYTRALGNIDLLRFPLVIGGSFVAVDKAVNGVLDVDGDGRSDGVAVRAEVTVIGFETVATTAGSFEKALHARTVVTQTFTLSFSGRRVTVTSTSDDWFARDVGPVRSVVTTVADGFNERVESALQSYKVGTMRSERVAPSVVAVTPSEGSATRVAEVRATFSEDMETTTLPTDGMALLGPDGAPVAGHFLWEGERDLRFVADGALASGMYTATVAAAVEDRAGNPMSSPAVWHFALDSTGPTLVATSPLRDAIDVPLDVAIKLTFDEAPDPASVTAGNFWLEESGLLVAASVTLQGSEVTLTPQQPLKQAGNYTVWVSRFVTDTLGNPIDTYINFPFKADPGRFAAPVQVSALGLPMAVQLADVDADGRVDVVVAEGTAPSRSRVLVVRRRADGSLADTADVLPVMSGCFPRALAVADFDGDGLLDVASAGTSCGLVIARQASPGVWVNQGAVTQDIVTDIRSVPLAGQARPALVGIVGGRLLLWRPAAGGGFLAPEDLYSVGYALNTLEVGDVDSDGRVDIVASGVLDVGAGLVVARQTAGGVFVVQPLQNEAAGGGDIAIGDVNGDGRADIVYVTSGSQRMLGVLLQTADGALAPATFTATQRFNPYAVNVTDVDGDGRQDVVLAHESDDVISVYRQTPAGTLGAEELFEVQADQSTLSWNALAVGELSGDGRVDILLGTQLLRQRALPAATTAARRTGLRWGAAVAPASR